MERKKKRRSSSIIIITDTEELEQPGQHQQQESAGRGGRAIVTSGPSQKLDFSYRAYLAWQRRLLALRGNTDNFLSRITERSRREYETRCFDDVSAIKHEQTFCASTLPPQHIPSSSGMKNMMKQKYKHQVS
eukprot:768489-Hanusia_phi.AAC.8